MTNSSSKPNYFLLGTILFVILMSAGGLYTSLHLVDLHYRGAGRTIEFFENFPSLKFLKKHVPQKYFVPKPTLEIKDTPDEELAQNYNVFSDFQNSEPGAAQGNPSDDPYSDIQNQDPDKWRKEQEDKQKDETCDINEQYSCSTVDESPYSQVGGIAVSVIGAAGYVILIMLGLIVLVQKPRKPNLTVGFIWIGTVIGFTYSIYLTYLEAYEIRAYCPYCLASAGFMALIFAAMLTFTLASDKQS